jgi:putative transposase
LSFLKVSKLSYSKTIHNSGLAAHVGIQKMIGLVREKFVWAGMTADIKRLVTSCDTCLKAKKNYKLEHTERTLFEPTVQPFQVCHTDFQGPLDVTPRGNMYICNVIDRFTGYAICWPCKDTSAQRFANDFYDKVCTIFGFPATLVSDRGAAYVSHVWKHISERLGIKLAHTSPYHASTNGKSERLNGTVSDLLRSLASEHPKGWDMHLPSVVFAINSTINSAHGLSPNVCLFGRQLPTIIGNPKLEVQGTDVTYELMERILQSQIIAQDIASKLTQSRDEQLQDTYNAKIKSSQIVPGDICFWQRPVVIERGRPSKLQCTTTGPYIVTSRNENTVTIRHLHTNKVHPSHVSISQLKRPSPYYRRNQQHFGNAQGQVVPPAASEESDGHEDRKLAPTKHPPEK